MRSLALSEESSPACIVTLSLSLVRVAALVALLAVGAIVVPAAATDRVVVVRQGDTLSEIALRHGVTVAS